MKRNSACAAGFRTRIQIAWPCLRIYRKLIVCFWIRKLLPKEDADARVQSLVANSRQETGIPCLLIKQQLQGIAIMAAILSECGPTYGFCFASAGQLQLA